MPTIRQKIADVLLGPERQKLQESARLMYQAYIDGPWLNTPENLMSQLREVDSAYLVDMVNQLAFESLGFLGSSTTDTEAERIRAIDESRRAFKYDPVTCQVISVWTDFGFGKSVEISSIDEKAQIRLDEFWDADRNAYLLGSDEIQEMSNDVLVDGERFLVFFVSKIDGLVTVNEIDTKEITQIITHPDNAYQKLFYKRTWSTSKFTGQEMYYPDYLARLSGALDSIPEDLLPRGAKRADLENDTTDVFILHVAHNKKGGARGWPIMTAGLPWSREHRRFRENRATVSAAQAMYVRKLKVSGGTRAVDAMRTKMQSALTQTAYSDTNPPATAGSTFIENQAATLEDLPKGTGAGDAKEDGQALAWMAFLAGGIFPHYGGLGDAYRLATACYSDDTELLAECGWIKWQEWQKGQKIATYNHDLKRIEYIEPVKLHVYDYSGVMVSIQGRGVDALVTPNHRMLILNENNTSKQWAKKYFEVRQADKLPSRFALPTYAELSIPDTEIYTIPGQSWITPKIHSNHSIDSRTVNMDDWLRFVGLWISEGSISISHESIYGIEIGQSNVYPEYQERIRSILSKLPFGFQESSSGEIQRWRCYDRALYIWLEQNCGKGAVNKHIPQFAYSLNARQSKILLDALWDGDGHWESQEHYRGFYSSTSKQLIDEVQILILHTGEWGGLALARGENDHALFDKISPEWVIHRNEYGKRSLVRRKNVSEIQYSGKVWCFEAPPNGMFITRRNGQPLIAGNTAMELPVKKKMDRYQEFWQEQFRKIAKVILWSGETYGGETYETTEVDVAMDKLLDFDLGTVSQLFANVFNPNYEAGLIPSEAAKGSLAQIWRIILQLLGISNANDLTSDEAFEIGQEPEQTAGQVAEGIARLRTEIREMVAQAEGGNGKT